MNIYKRVEPRVADRACALPSRLQLQRVAGTWQLSAELSGGAKGFSEADHPAFCGGALGKSCYSPYHTHTQSLSLYIFKKLSRTKASLNLQPHQPLPFLVVLPAPTTFKFSFPEARIFPDKIFF